MNYAFISSIIWIDGIVTYIFYIVHGTTEIVCTDTVQMLYLCSLFSASLDSVSFCIFTTSSTCIFCFSSLVVSLTYFPALFYLVACFVLASKKCLQVVECLCGRKALNSYLKFRKSVLKQKHCDKKTFRCTR
jgi:hypothetical protein